MQKIGSITPTADAKGEWTNGNVAAGTPPTIMDAAWFNTVQREIANVVTKAGLTLDPSNDGQLFAALQLLTGPGRLLNTQLFTTSGIYTPTVGTRTIIIELLGGGGAGGGSAPTSSGQQASGSGGGSGGYVKARLTSGFSGQPITIGAGGTGVSNSNGNPGGNTLFMSLTATGGGGGVTGAATTLAVTPEGPGGIGSGGFIAAAGAGGFPSIVYSSVLAQSGKGAGSYLYPGGGATGTVQPRDGYDATQYGCGGGGSNSAPSGAARKGGSGFQGVAIIWEYS